MSYKIIVDSSCELPEEFIEDSHFCSIPFGLEVDGKHFVDNKELDVEELLRQIAACPTCPKSSCPSPQLFLENMECDADHIYIVTISSQLSGCYNSAVLAKNMYEVQKADKKIAVIDSQSASGGETQIALLARELEEAGKSFEEIEKQLNEYRDAMETTFVLDNVETLRKNGRLSNLKAFIASTLNIKPVMGATKEGLICQLSQARGINKALDKMVQTMIEKTTDCENRILAISHCNCPERAKAVKEKIEQLVTFKRIIVIDTAGVSSMYANDGGVIMVV